jgi:hypothetical protein|tara:strand:- start:1466 stop:1705 length:240 start_codon:yes stop_codon:yes gene_type:complete
MDETEILVYLEWMTIVHVGFSMSGNSEMNCSHWIAIANNVFRVGFPEIAKIEESFEKMEDSIFSVHVSSTIIIIEKTGV